MHDCPLQNPVNKKSVIDYNKFILPEDEMWIKKITGKLIKSGYTSHKQFKADLHQLMTNAQTYNGSEGGVCAYPRKQSHFGCYMLAALHAQRSCFETCNRCLLCQLFIAAITFCYNTCGHFAYSHAAIPGKYLAKLTSVQAC